MTKIETKASANNPPPVKGLLGQLYGEPYRRTADLSEGIKFGQLFFEFGIDVVNKSADDCWFQLARALANKYVPAFKSKARGAPRKWTTLTMGALVVEIEREIKANKLNKTVGAAAKKLLKRDAWSNFMGDKSNPEETLRKKYQDYKNKSYAKLYRDAFSWHMVNGDIQSWDEWVEDVLKQPMIGDTKIGL